MESLEEIVGRDRPDPKVWISLPSAHRMLRGLDGRPLNPMVLFFLSDQADSKGNPLLEMLPFWVRSKQAYRYYINRAQVQRLSKSLAEARNYVARHGPCAIPQMEAKILSTSYSRPQREENDWLRELPIDREFLDDSYPETLKEEEIESIRQSTVFA